MIWIFIVVTLVVTIIYGIVGVSAVTFGFGFYRSPEYSVGVDFAVNEFDGIDSDTDEEVLIIDKTLSFRLLFCEVYVTFTKITA